ncbi:MAG TPA: hypothetical protein ENI96_09375 [Sedimenticola thiotaurini]|uniref:Uncharacterized protein n=1 Tax=Sedimenticola thiotaurini TaxID=1543721 RepID=A0A831RQ35_9GAMM|nr:hypothetical protein [Sedimenticola thiotaurini]
MIVIVPNLPADFGPARLRLLARDTLRGIWLLPSSRRGRIEGCEILHIRDADGLVEEFHGLIHLSESAAGKAFIRQLNRQSVGGRRIQAREYIERSPERDHRVGLRPPAPLAIVDRRKGDRRRQHLTREILPAR